MKRILVAATLAFAAVAAQATTDAPKATNPPAAAAPSKADIMARGQQIAGAVCVACHGLDGMSAVPANPNIAGMPAQYIAKQLELFKSGARKNAVMQGMAANLTADDMKALGAYYFSQMAKNNAVARDAALATKGQKIYRSGIAELKVPACAGCHGGAGAGIPAAYPRLAGQWPEYTFEELRLYASGARKNVQMNAIASRMRESDMQAVSEYIAGMRSK
ncbi:MAG: cytochrome c4 [Betaproteobacteria bacterium]|nr:cytochrome c4 [Betaproteobacteria bacterium]